MKTCFRPRCATLLVKWLMQKQFSVCCSCLLAAYYYPVVVPYIVVVPPAYLSRQHHNGLLKTLKLATENFPLPPPPLSQH